MGCQIEPLGRLFINKTLFSKMKASGNITGQLVRKGALRLSQKIMVQFLPPPNFGVFFQIWWISKNPTISLRFLCFLGKSTKFWLNQLLKQVTNKSNMLQFTQYVQIRVNLSFQVKTQEPLQLQGVAIQQYVSYFSLLQP